MKLDEKKVRTPTFHTLPVATDVGVSTLLGLSKALPIAESLEKCGCLNSASLAIDRTIPYENGEAVT